MYCFVFNENRMSRDRRQVILKFWARKYMTSFRIYIILQYKDLEIMLVWDMLCIVLQHETQQLITWI